MRFLQGDIHCFLADCSRLTWHKCRQTSIEKKEVKRIRKNLHHLVLNLGH